MGLSQFCFCEAMKQALEALEHTLNNSIWRDQTFEAITALRQAIAEAEKPSGFVDSKINPIKREWVGLEASEYVAFYNQFANYQEENPDDSGWWAFANAIEQALKEKNT
jgi:hypothetical protein